MPTRKPRDRNGAAPDRVPRKNLSAYIDTELDAEIRAMIRDLRRRVDPDEFNISRFVHEALKAHVLRYRKLHNNGKPWPTTSEFVRIPTGRPMKRAG